MFESLNTPEIQRLALIIGAFVSIIYKNKYGIIPGGVLAPGFIIILFLISPLWCLGIIALSFLTYYLYQNFFHSASYKVRTPMYILSGLSLLLANLLAFIYIQLGWFFPSLDTLATTLIPAIIAFSFSRQQITKVVKGMTVTTTMTILFLASIYGIGSYIGIDFDTVRALYVDEKMLEFQYPLIQFYLVLTTGYLVYRYTDIRSGGYIVASVAAALLIHPLSAIIFVASCFFLYRLTKFICDHSLIIGLNRYALALFLSTVFVWFVEIIILKIDPTLAPFQGTSILNIIAIMSYVNDGMLYAGKQIFFYISITLVVAIASLLATNIIALALT